MARVIAEHCKLLDRRGSPLLPASLLAGLLTAGALQLFPGWAAETNAPAPQSFRDERAAHALYSQMVATMRKADTLSWVSDYRWESRGQAIGHAIYRIQNS